MTSDSVPDDIKITVDTILKCGDAEFQWVQMGMGLLLKALVAEILDDRLAEDPSDWQAWIIKTNRNLVNYSREDLAKMLLGWHRSMADYATRRVCPPAA